MLYKCSDGPLILRFGILLWRKNCQQWKQNDWRKYLVPYNNYVLLFWTLPKSSQMCCNVIWRKIMMISFRIDFPGMSWICSLRLVILVLSIFTLTEEYGHQDWKLVIIGIGDVNQKMFYWRKILREEAFKIGELHGLKRMSWFTSVQFVYDFLFMVQWINIDITLSLYLMQLQLPTLSSPS